MARARQRVAGASRAIAARACPRPPRGRARRGGHTQPANGERHLPHLAGLHVHEQDAVDVEHEEVLQQLPPGGRPERVGRQRAGLHLRNEARLPTAHQQVGAAADEDLHPIDPHRPLLAHLPLLHGVAELAQEPLRAELAAGRHPQAPPTPASEPAALPGPGRQRAEEQEGEEQHEQPGETHAAQSAPGGRQKLAGGRESALHHVPLRPRPRRAQRRFVAEEGAGRNSRRGLRACRGQRGADYVGGGTGRSCPASKCFRAATRRQSRSVTPRSVIPSSLPRRRRTRR